MREMADKFRASGGEIYVPAPSVGRAQSNGAQSGSVGRSGQPPSE
jgi:hypothetical protein